MHKEVSKLLARDVTDPFQSHMFDIDKSISNVDGTLWSVLTLLTRSISERRGTARVVDPTSHSYLIKRIRRFYCLCCLMFCTDNRCSLPLHAPGTLADTALHNAQMDVGYLSFLRLVGTVYYKKYNTGFETPNPVTHFNSFHQPDTTPVLQHHQWMENIRQTIWDRVQFETEMIPSNDALDRHWKRTCWVLDMWKQSSQSTMLLKPLTDYGWRIEGDELMYEWDSEENMAVVRQRVDTLLKGCHCKTGCKTARCSCRKKETQCAAECECVNYYNRSSVHPTEDDSLLAVSFEEEILEQSHDQQLLREVEETMQMVFGDDDMPYTSSSEDDDIDNA